MGLASLRADAAHLNSVTFSVRSGRDSPSSTDLSNFIVLTALLQ
jgi:hypothetical protein